MNKRGHNVMIPPIPVLLSLIFSRDSKEIRPSVLKEINPEYSVEGLMLKLKLWYFGHLIQRTDSLEKTLMLGKIEGRRRRGRQRMRWLDGVTDSMDMSLSKFQSWWWAGRPGVLRSTELQRVGHDWPELMSKKSERMLKKKKNPWRECDLRNH